MRFDNQWDNQQLRLDFIQEVDGPTVLRCSTANLELD